MNRIKSVWLITTLLSISVFCQAQDDAERFGGVVNQYCVTCHNDTLRTAGFSLQQADLANMGEHAETWEKVLRKVKVKTMPPSGMPRPDDPTYAAFANFLTTSLDNHSAQNPRPGEAAIRRLNRTEYFNAIKDLFGIEINNKNILPADDSMFGFDNVGQVLTLSPLLAEQYIAAARFIRRQVMGDPDMPPEYHSYSLPMYLMQDDWISEDLPFGSRGGMAIDHYFPMDGEYDVRIRLQRNSRDYIRGLINKPHLLDVRLDGERVKVFTVGGEKLGSSSGVLSTSAQGDVDQEQYERHSDETLVVRFPAKAGIRKVTVSFLNETIVQEDPLYTQMSIIDYAQYKGGVPGIDTVTIGGPYEAEISEVSPSRNRVLICRPSSANDEACAENIITNLARRAYRRPPTSKEVAGLMTFYRMGQVEGGFDEGIGLAVERIIAGPKFLFITEYPPESASPGEVYRISDLELATRLSLFLWSSVPDNELLQMAESGQLSEPSVLERQVQRMLDSPASGALVENFGAQWLNLRNLNGSAPDGEQFPYFDDNLRRAFQMETRLFFEHVLKQDRPLMELLDADYTFVNERLAHHYGIPGIYGSHFRKVSLTDGLRGGLLGQGSILTVTSYANRTAPTIRGKWVLENILGAPPPPPPPDVPGLRETNEDGKVLNMRQRMEQHRANPVCASCHKVMDPLGFALENYDAIGKWRTMDADSGTPIDASGNLPDGTEFEGLYGLREVLQDKRQYDFVMTAIEKMLTYALNRGVEFTDMPAMRTIMRNSEPNDFRLSSIIMAIIESAPFQTRRVPDHADL